MKNSKTSFVLAAAGAGLIGGATARAARPLPAQLGMAPVPELVAAEKKEIEKHACKGLNSCKGNGGGSKKEWGKNSCKGKGGCATDGSKPPAGKK
jgi:hypothetical protein